MQVTSHLLLVKPASPGFNEQTAASNVFQKVISTHPATIRQVVEKEFNGFEKALRARGLNVLVIEDNVLPQKPDAIFPNNWGSYHEDGTVVLYPMAAPSRRPEKRPEILSAIQERYEVKQVIDLSDYELANRFLEGTGSIIFDHEHRVAYAGISPRTDPGLFAGLAEKLQYHPISFYAHDPAGVELYHTNVMMCIAEKFAVICLDAITDGAERALVTESLTRTNHEIIEISFEQMGRFAGNMLALKNKEGQDLLVLSQTAFDSLLMHQRTRIARYCELLPLAIPMIEAIGGGSARCMIAEIFLPLKNAAAASLGK